MGLVFLCSIAMLKPVTAQNAQVAVIPNSNRVSETPIDKLVKVQRFLRIYSNIGKFSGVAILAKDGKAIHKFTTKYSTLDFKIRCALSTQFNTCDITETFTATAIMQLVDQGKIGLEDKVGQYLFNLPPQIGETVTIHQLLTHSSGLKDYYNIEEYREHFYDIKDMKTLISILSKYPLDFVPGSQVKKSTIGYTFLGGIIEQISGMDYREYIQKNIFQPTGMNQSGLYSWFDPAEEQAVGYVPDRRGAPTKSPEYWGAHAFGADALHCSIEDLLKFNNAFQNGGLISPKSKSLMLAPQFTNPADLNQHISYGWKLKEEGEHKIVYQGGALGGLSAALRHYVNDNYTVLIYSNYGDNTANLVADKIEGILTGNYTTVPNHSIGYVLYELINEKGVEFAIDNFDAILKQHELPLKDMWPLYSLGQDYLKEGKAQTALQLFQLGAKRYPNDPMIYDAMGDCYHTLGDKGMAKQSFETKLRLQPNDERAKRMLGVIEETNYAHISKPQPAAPAVSTEQSLVSKPTSVENENDNSFVKTNYTPTPNSTSANEVLGNSRIYTTVDVMPQFPGGQSALHQFIYQNLRYPTMAYINNLEGIVYVDFVVDNYGNIINPTTNSDVDESNDGGLRMEALRLINSMPRWKSGVHMGEEVMVKITIPIQFNKGSFTDGNENSGK